MRFQKLKVPARATALALGLALVGMLVTALPALAAADTVTGFTPVCGVVGTSVTITGTGFTAGATATAVTFPGGIDKAVVPASDTQIVTTVPAGSTGTAPLVVKDTDGDGTSSASFTVAAAAATTITSFLPTGGPVGTSVVITGTNFCGTTGVTFNTTSATTLTVNSATQITATVPAAATTGPIHVMTPSGTANSAASFTVGPAPTITSFAPTSGHVGKSVTITGTNLTGVTSVKFNGVSATFSANTATSVKATVPSGATTGKIVVTAATGTASSATDFMVTTLTKHARSVSLTLRKHLIARGRVHVGDGFNACRSHVTVKIQRLKHGVWRVVGTDQTTANGKYKEVVKDRTGKYRAIAKKKVLNGGDDICVAALSAPRRHHH